jgi:hypothetical protein
MLQMHLSANTQNGVLAARGRDESAPGEKIVKSRLTLPKAHLGRS